MSSSRFNAWAAQAVFSVIALVSITSTTNSDLWESEEKFAISVTSIGLALGTLAMFSGAILKDKFNGTYIEGGMAVIVFAMWCAGLSVIMNPGNALAQDGSGSILRNNLYFFSWGAFISSFLLTMHFVNEKTEFSKDDVSDHSLGWGAMAVAGLVVTASATRFYKTNNCSDAVDSKTCDRTVLAFSLGVASFLLGAIMVFLGRKWNWLEWTVSLCLLAAWCFGVGYITFGEGPASLFLGNLYFSTWASFVLALHISADSFMALWNCLFGGDEEGGEEAAEEKEDAGEGGDDKAEDVEA